MTKRMLLDASHPDETRVVVLSGNRLDEFDYETKDKKQLKGNIYLAKITRVEPSLQAAFVDYGGNRHGFLPFSEIHPDYYRLPIADREALIAEEEAAQRRQAEEDAEAGDAGLNGDGESGESDAEAEAAAAGSKRRRSRRKPVENGEDDRNGDSEEGRDAAVEEVETTTSVETLAGDEIEDAARRRAANLGRYKIQEVIKRRQVILVQVVKEERGNKGAALTTYLSLAGRYCVLMPNTNKGGGISRKIASAQDRKRLKGVLSELHIPEGVAVIVRTAGSNRSKLEIKRDYEYLLRLWDQIRSTTLASSAPSLIYEEANLIKRSVRDLYTRDMNEILVEGEEGYKAAKGFMRSLMPSHAKKVKKYDDPAVPLFHRNQVESQLDNIHNPSVQLKSGGYIVMNQTEALVAIDVNSGKATKERHIEETALKTNLEAADEIARQLKLRDLAGLIVIDFIDMDAAKNNREVEQRLKEAMRQDRARIQLGRISPFGLLELSRQRLRPSLHETSTELCRTCGGSGFVRSPDSTALHLLRALEEEGIKRGSGEVLLTVPPGVALYILNDKRERLIEVERRYAFKVRIETDDHLIPPVFRLERISTGPADDRTDDHRAEAMTDAPDSASDAALEDDLADDGGVSEVDSGDSAEKRRRRGRRGGRKRRQQTDAPEARQDHETDRQDRQAVDATEDATADDEGEKDDDSRTAADADGEDEASQKARRRRRRGKRGGRRRARRRDSEDQDTGESGDDAHAAPHDAAEADDRPTAEQAGPDEDTSPEAPAAAPAVASAGDDVEAEDAAEPKAKPKRSRTRTRKSRAKTAETTPETAADAGPGETAEPTGEAAAATEAASGDAEKPKRRSRKKPASGTARGRRTKAADTSADASEEKPAAAPASAPPASGAADAGPPPDGPDQSGSDRQPAPESAQDSAVGEAAQPTSGDDLATREKPKTRRRGWWQKLVN